MEGHALPQELHSNNGYVANRDVIPFLQNLASKGDVQKAGFLGRIFSDGTDGVAQNEAQAFKYTLAAAEGGAHLETCSL